jgi:molecular chaperone GrpE (heat shock protein)
VEELALTLENMGLRSALARSERELEQQDEAVESLAAEVRELRRELAREQARTLFALFART